MAVVASAFAISWRKIGDFDTWWHLASGRWIAAHHAIPSTDTLSHTVQGHPWINLQWGFDLALYALHAIGGPALISFAGAVAFAAAILLLLLIVRRPLGDGLGALLMLLVVLEAQERVLGRPELLTFLLLAAVLFVLERGRPHGRGLFLLVPLMILWVNVHALFVVGAFAIVCAGIGTIPRPPRALLVWGGAALASVVLNPYTFRGVLFPLTLLSRIDGSNPVFQSVGEFASPFTPGSTDVSTIAYKVALAAGGLAAAAALIGSLRRPRANAPGRERFDWGGLALFAGLAVVSVEARRNIALFAIGTAPFIARCLAKAREDWPASRRVFTRASPLAAATAVVAAAGVAVSAVSGAFYKWDREPQEFGGGVMEGVFPVRASAFVRAAALPPPLFNDMLGGGYLAWDDPFGAGVFVDGRLEVYDTSFLADYVAAVSEPARWPAYADRYGVQTAIICHGNEADRALVGALIRDARWSLVYGDEVAAVFVRTAGHAGVIARAAALRPAWDARTDAWLAAPAARWPYLAGRVEGTRAFARYLATIGSAEAAVHAYLVLLDLGIPRDDEVDVRLLLARHFAGTGRRSEAEEQARRILAIDPDNGEAQSLVR